MPQYGKYTPWTPWVSSKTTIDTEANDGHVGENPFKVSLWDIHSVFPLMRLLYLPQRPQVQAVKRSKSVRVRF